MQHGNKKTDKQPIVGIIILKRINLEAIEKEINLLLVLLWGIRMWALELIVDINLNQYLPAEAAKNCIFLVV